MRTSSDFLNELHVQETNDFDEICLGIILKKWLCNFRCCTTIERVKIKSEYFSGNNRFLYHNKRSLTYSCCREDSIFENSMFFQSTSNYPEKRKRNRIDDKWSRGKFPFNRIERWKSERYRRVKNQFVDRNERRLRSDIWVSFNERSWIVILTNLMSFCESSFLIVVVCIHVILETWIQISNKAQLRMLHEM